MKKKNEIVWKIRDKNNTLILQDYRKCHTARLKKSNQASTHFTEKVAMIVSTATVLLLSFL